MTMFNLDAGSGIGYKIMPVVRVTHLPTGLMILSSDLRTTEENIEYAKGRLIHYLEMIGYGEADFEEDNFKVDICHGY